MSYLMYISYILWGIIIGWLSGLLGLGGGVFAIPTLVYLFGLSETKAHGTTLAMMLPPIGLLAAYRYWQNDNVAIPIAIFGALGFFIGGYFGAGAALYISEESLKKVFGVFMVLMGIRMLI
ncbi:MAG: sulfite exporter TauE/SafE family protein [Candidatus Riflebacteria bacterium]|nr:sulfite exporter TauE/SafE family protein [Candidatus Riflebacteria bacterium]